MDDSIGIPLLDCHDLHGDFILRGGIRDEDGLIIISAYTVATEGDILDDERNDHPLPKEGNFPFDIHDKSSLYNPSDYC